MMSQEPAAADEKGKKERERERERQRQRERERAEPFSLIGPNSLFM